MPRAARDRLARRFGSPDPADWRLPERTIKFDAMGALPEVDLPIVHRGTFNHVVSPAGGGESVLPPANSGHVPLGRLRAVVGGDAPEGLRDQLELYERFEYKPFPVDRDAVEDRAVSSETLEVRPVGGFARLRALVRG